MALTSDLHFQLSYSPLEPQQLLLESSLLALERRNLLLDSAIFCLLEIEVPLPTINVTSYISSSIRTSSLERLFLTSAVFMVSTDSSVSFSLLRICTSFLWLLSSFEMFFICCWVRNTVLPGIAACPSARPGCC